MTVFEDHTIDRKLNDRKDTNFSLWQANHIKIEATITKPMPGNGFVDADEIYWRVRRSGTSQGDVLIEKTIGNGIEVNNHTTIYITLRELDTPFLRGHYHHDCRVVIEEENFNRVVFSGTMVVDPTALLPRGGGDFEQEDLEDKTEVDFQNIDATFSASMFPKLKELGRMELKPFEVGNLNRQRNFAGWDQATIYDEIMYGNNVYGSPDSKGGEFKFSGFTATHTAALIYESILAEVQNSPQIAVDGIDTTFVLSPDPRDVQNVGDVELDSFTATYSVEETSATYGSAKYDKTLYDSEFVYV